MRHCFLLSALGAAFAFSAIADGTVRANWFETDISPEVGTLLAGYGANDVSDGKYDNLLAAIGLLMAFACGPYSLPIRKVNWSSSSPRSGSSPSTR